MTLSTLSQNLVAATSLQESAIMSNCRPGEVAEWSKAADC